MLDAAEPIDQTVPLHPAEGQLKNGNFRATSRQTGYVHHASYSNDGVISATLYSLVRIASKMKWSK